MVPFKMTKMQKYSKTAVASKKKEQLGWKMPSQAFFFNYSPPFITHSTNTMPKGTWAHVKVEKNIHRVTLLTGRQLIVKNRRFSETEFRLTEHLFQHPPFRTKHFEESNKLGHSCSPSLLKIPSFSLPLTLQIGKLQWMLPNFGRLTVLWHRFLWCLWQLYRNQLFPTVPLT